MEKSITIGNSACSVKDMIDALQNNKDVWRFKIKLCIEKEDDKNEKTAMDMTIRLCSELYIALLDARKAIEACADIEKKTGEKTIYYDKYYNGNGGATHLLKQTNEILDNYHKRCVQIDLLR